MNIQEGLSDLYVENKQNMIFEIVLSKVICLLSYECVFNNYFFLNKSK